MSHRSILLARSLAASAVMAIVAETSIRFTRAENGLLIAVVAIVASESSASPAWPAKLQGELCYTTASLPQGEPIDEPNRPAGTLPSPGASSDKNKSRRAS